MLFGPSIHDIASLVRGIKDTLGDFGAEYSRSLHHMDASVDDMLELERTRELTRDTVEEVQRCHARIRRALAIARNELHDAEFELDNLRNRFVTLEPARG